VEAEQKDTLNLIFETFKSTFNVVQQQIKSGNFLLEKTEWAGQLDRLRTDLLDKKLRIKSSSDFVKRLQLELLGQSTTEKLALFKDNGQGLRQKMPSVETFAFSGDF